jgi:uncharacterized membrane protein YdbT with pleckstrin-like domain
MGILWISADSDSEKMSLLIMQFRAPLLILFSILVTWILSSPFYELLYYLNYHYDMDDRNVLIRKGIVAKREITLPFSKITDVYVDQDVADVVLGLYDIHISTPTVESGRFAHIDGLNRKGATEIRKLILDHVHSYTSLGGKESIPKVAEDSIDIDLKEPSE